MSNLLTHLKLMRPLAVAAVLLSALAPRLGAHEVPNEVTVYGFVHPEGRSLTLLLRAPLRSMRDVDVPVLENGFLDLSRVDRALNDAATLWIVDFVELYENGRRLARPRVAGARVSLPSDRSFESFAAARDSILTGQRLGQDTQIYWEQGLMDIAFEYPITSDQADFAIRPGLTRLGLRVNVVLTFQPAGQPERVFDVHADTGTLHLDPRWHQAFYLFVREGFFHILQGTDHLLFLLCLVIPFRQLRPLVIVVTAFTVAHSVTLIASAFGLAPDGLWFQPLVETLIAVSILYMAFENIAGANLQRRWAVTFGFGLVHGFGFSFLLRDRLQFAGDHVLSSLLAFNVGVEMGQLLVLIGAIPLLAVVRLLVADRMVIILMSAVVAHTALHWAMDRGSVLVGYPWPAFTLADVAAFVRLLMVALTAAFAVWLLRLWVGVPATEPATSAPVTKETAR